MSELEWRKKWFKKFAYVPFGGVKLMARSPAISGPLFLTEKVKVTCSVVEG